MKKTVFITGASSGFGRAAIRLFQRNGWNVVASMRSPGKEKELNTLENVFVTKLDVTRKTDIDQAVQAAVSRFGQIDVLINNAGFGTIGALEAASREIIHQQFDVNFFGVIDVIQAVLPFMRQRKNGIIINVSSIGGRLTFPFSTLYHATKFAMEGLTESLQYELNPLGIQLKIVEPGGYKTDFAGRSMGHYGVGGIGDYETAFRTVWSKIESWPMSENIGEVAEAMYLAATDGTAQLRYPVGQDAVQLLEVRKQTDDVTFKNMMAGQLGI